MRVVKMGGGGERGEGRGARAEGGYFLIWVCISVSH